MSQVLNMMKNVNNPFGGGSAVVADSSETPIVTPVGKGLRKRNSTSKSKGLQRSLSAKDLLTTSKGKRPDSAFVRGMQNLTQRLFGKMGNSGRVVGKLSPNQNRAKVTPAELVELQQKEEQSELQRQRWQQAKISVLQQKRAEAARKGSGSEAEAKEAEREMMQQDIERIGVGIFAPTTPLGMATCMRSLDVVRFLISHGADPTLTTPIKIFRATKNDNFFSNLRRSQRPQGDVMQGPGVIQNHGMSAYQVALFVYHELRMIRQTIEDDRGDEDFYEENETQIVNSLDKNIEMATKLIDELNGAHVTRRVRNWFAVRKCSGGIIPNLFMWLLLLAASPSFYDGYLNYDAFVFKRELETTFTTALDVPGSISNDPTVWLNTWQADPTFNGMFGYELGAPLAQNGTVDPSDEPCRVQFRHKPAFLVGPLQIQVRRFTKSSACSAAQPQRWFGQDNYPSIAAESLPDACYEAFGGHITAIDRTDLDGEDNWKNVHYGCGHYGGVAWADWDNQTTADLIGLNASLAYGGELYGTPEYYQTIGAVSDIEIRGLLYHPDLNRFATVDAKASFQSSGLVNVLTDVKLAQFEGRFPPSIEFEIVVVLVMAMSVVEIFRATMRKDGVYDSVAIRGDTPWQRIEFWFRRMWGYLMLDATISILALVLFCFDLFLLTQLSSVDVLDLFNRSSCPDKMFSLLDLVVAEQSLLGLVAFVLGFRLVKYLRFLPVCGPEIISIVMTVFHREVLLYVSVVCLVLALFSISGQIVFGMWIDLTPMTFIRIFNLNFAEKKNDFFVDAAPHVESQVSFVALFTVLFCCGGFAAPCRSMHACMHAGRQAGMIFHCQTQPVSFSTSQYDLCSALCICLFLVLGCRLLSWGCTCSTSFSHW